MRMTEQEYTDLIARQQAASVPRKQVKAPEPIQRAGVKKTTRQTGPNKQEAQKKTLVIVLPFKLPTWNLLLSCNPWKRKKVRDLIHELVLAFTPKESASLTPMEYQQKQLSMASCIAEYYRTMGQSTSVKSPTVKSRPKKTRRSSR